MRLEEAWYRADSVLQQVNGQWRSGVSGCLRSPLIRIPQMGVVQTADPPNNRSEKTISGIDPIARALKALPGNLFTASPKTTNHSIHGSQH